VAGLDTDYRGRPFEPMPRLLAIAEEITKLLGDLHALRKSGSTHATIGRKAKKLIVVGAGGAYEARCREDVLSRIPRR